MLYRLLAVLSFLIFGATQALAADCIIVGGESSYRIPDCIANSPITAVQKFLGSNYAIITDRKDGKILAVIIAEMNNDSDDQDASAKPSDSAPIPQPLQEHQSINFPAPIPLSSADQAINELRSNGKALIKFTVAVGQFHRLYDINNDESVADVLRREEQNLLEFLEDQKRAAVESMPSEFLQRSLQVIEESRNALLDGNVVLTAVDVLQ